jgi:hypothetical protein
LFPNHVQICAIDCSYIPKSGKKTFGLDKFWSGVSNKTLKGLEITALSIINVVLSHAWILDVCQTPPNIEVKEGTEKNYTRVNFYIEQILDCLPALQYIKYIVADGFYAKKKFIDAICNMNKHLITKLRCDANLRFLHTGQQHNGQGAPKKYADKVTYDNLSNWYFAGIDYNYEYLEIYYQVLNSPRFGRNFKVVLVLNKRSNTFILLASTDLNQSARQILEYYQLRFQIEFLFRDAKQFTCLNHCQARDEQKLDFHFNMSLSAINICRAIMIEENEKSLNNIVRASYNERFLGFIFSKLRFEPDFEINNDELKQIIEYGSMRA